MAGHSVVCESHGSGASSAFHMPTAAIVSVISQKTELLSWYSLIFAFAPPKLLIHTMHVPVNYGMVSLIAGILQSGVTKVMKRIRI